MEKKKNSRITEIIVAGIVIICLGLIVLQLSDNISDNIYERNRHSAVTD